MADVPEAEGWTLDELDELGELEHAGDPDVTFVDEPPELENPHGPEALHGSNTEDEMLETIGPDDPDPVIDEWTGD